MKLKYFLKRNPQVELEFVDFAFRAFKEGDKVTLKDVEAKIENLISEGILPNEHPNAMAFFNGFFR